MAEDKDRAKRGGGIGEKVKRKEDRILGEVSGVCKEV